MSDGIRVDAEFASLLRPLKPEEIAGLEESLLEDGCRDALVVWAPHNILLDGYHRKRLCEKHKIGFAIKTVKLADRAAAIRWIKRHQGGRRNEATAFAKAEKVVEERKPAVAAEAAERQAATQIAAGSPPVVTARTAPQNVGKTRARLAAEAGVSERTIRETERVVAEGSDDLKKRLRDGDTTLAAAINELDASKPAAPGEPVDKLGDPLPNKPAIRADFARDGEIQSFMSILTKLKSDIKKRAEDKRDRIFSRLELQRFTTGLDECFHLLKGIRPYGLCPYCKGGERGGMDKCTACKGLGWADQYRYANAPAEMRRDKK